MKNALCLVLLLIAGCKSFVSSQDPLARDQEIRRDILWRFQKDERLTEVTVACDGGHITLGGRVTVPDATIAAVSIAETVRDVRSVANKIDVRPK